MRRLEALLKGKKVLAVEDGLSVYEAAAYMTKMKIGAVPVLRRGDIVGMFTERDLMTRVVVPGLDSRTTPISEVMTRDVVTANPSDRFLECRARMRSRHCRHMPVVENGRLLGTVSLRDLQAESLRKRNAEIRHLTDYIQDPGYGIV